MIGYILLTSGPKSTGDLVHHPMAQQQKKNLHGWKTWPENPRVVVEFTRKKIISLSTLPLLRKVLQRCTHGDEKLVIVDDLRRVFRKCPPDKRVGLLEELRAFEDYLHIIRAERTLAEFSPALLKDLLITPNAASFIFRGSHRLSSSEQERQVQTRDARAASVATRSSQADRNAAGLDGIRKDLALKHAKVTLAMIAAEANRRGKRTAHGNEWRKDTVLRTLRRLEPAEVPLQSD